MSFVKTSDVAVVDQHTTQITKNTHDTPGRPPPSDPIPNDIPISLDADTSPGGELPLNHNDNHLQTLCYNRLYIRRNHFLAIAYFSIKAFISEKRGGRDIYKRLYSTCCKASSKEVT